MDKPILIKFDTGEFYKNCQATLVDQTILTTTLHDSINTYLITVGHYTQKHDQSFLFNFLSV
jgi:hypothetical protein